MGVTIQFESHRVELPFIYEAEHDSQVLEYYDQPPSIPLVYRALNGRRLSVMHTPDYFVLRDGLSLLDRMQNRGRSRSACQPESQSLFSRHWRQVALYPR